MFLKTAYPANDAVTCTFAQEIINEYSKRLAESNHTHNFRYLYAFILILIPQSLYSYSKFEVYSSYSIQHNTYDVFDFDSPQLNIYTNHKKSMNIKILTKWFRDCSACCSLLICSLIFFFCKCLTTKTVNSNLNEQAFESNIFRMV